MPGLRQWLRQNAKDHPRRGFRPAYHDARAEGWHVNHKRSSGCGARKAYACRNNAAATRLGTCTAQRTSEGRCAGQDLSRRLPVRRTTAGRPMKKSCPSLANPPANTSADRRGPIDELDRLTAVRRYPAALRQRTRTGLCRHGRLSGRRVALHFIPPGEPWVNGYLESLNCRVRDECLNINICECWCGGSGWIAVRLGAGVRP